MTDPDRVTVRPAAPSDLPAMERAKLEAGIAAWPHIFPSDVLRQLRFPDRWRGAVQRPQRRTSAFVAETGAEVVGFAIVRPSADDDATEQTGELDGLYSEPAAWGRGAGRALMAAALESLRAHGFDRATLWTASANHRPRRIYELAGWRADGAVRHRQLGGAEFDELRYRINL